MSTKIQCSACKATYSPRWHAKHSISGTIVYCDFCHRKERSNSEGDPAALLHVGAVWSYKGVNYVIYSAANYLFQINDEWKDCVVYTLYGKRHGLRFVREKEEFLAKFTYMGDVSDV